MLSLIFTFAVVLCFTYSQRTIMIYYLLLGRACAFSNYCFVCILLFAVVVLVNTLQNTRGVLYQFMVCLVAITKVSGLFVGGGGGWGSACTMPNQCTTHTRHSHTRLTKQLSDHQLRAATQRIIGPDRVLASGCSGGYLPCPRLNLKEGSN